VQVCTLEEELPIPSYTVDTLEALAREHPACTFRLVVGADILEEVHQWKAWDKVEAQFTPIVVGRTGHGPGREAPSFPEVSSTELRAAWSLGKTPEGWASGEVERSVGRWFEPVPLMRDPNLESRTKIAHGYTTVQGGAHGPLTLAPHPTVAPDVLRGDWYRVVQALDGRLDVNQLVLLNQVHGGRVMVEPEPRGPWDVVGAGDGVVSTEVGRVLAIRTADCVPLLLAAPGGVGAAHAGWRGVVAGVVPATVEALCRAAKCDADALVASIGPHISGPSYEVGPEVVDGIASTGVPRSSFVLGGHARAHVDLGAAVEWQLKAIGVGTIGKMAGCTFEDPQLHSHRREGTDSGRQVALIARLS
jgi:YfiH family protein